jgi:hypothetical protein
MDNHVGRLRYGNDSDGNLCGVDNGNGRDFRTMKYSYAFNPTTMSTYRRCVTACPNATFVPICPYDVDVTDLLSAVLGKTPLETLKEMKKTSLSAGKYANCTLSYQSRSGES